MLHYDFYVFCESLLLYINLKYFCEAQLCSMFTKAKICQKRNENDKYFTF